MMNANVIFADHLHTGVDARTVLPANIDMDTAAISVSGVAPPLPGVDAPTVSREYTRNSTCRLHAVIQNQVLTSTPPFKYVLLFL